MFNMSEIELSTKTKNDEDSEVDDATTSNDSSDSNSGGHKEGRALLRTSLDEFDEHLESVVIASSNDASLQAARASRPTTFFGRVCRLWRKHLLGPDNPQGWTIRQCCNKSNENSNDEQVLTLLDASGLRLLKFFIVSVLSIVAVHGYAWIADDKRDESYDWHNMLVYDGKPIAMDIVVFFLVGRIYESNTPIDTLSFVVPLLGTAVFQSWGATHLHSLQHSITPYELKCEWTWQMYLLVMGGCLPLLGGLLVAHCREVYRRGTGLRHLVEFVGTGVLFLLPYGAADGRFFHLHHWYYGWFLGMHCNLHGSWWSELAMSVLWGIYINGVAIFGRDSVLTCASTLYQSQSQECEYLPSDTGYGLYTLDDLAHDSGKILDEVSDDTGDAIICASDVTRWLSST